VRWRLVFTRQAKTDAKKLARSGLKPQAERILEILAENPYRPSPAYEKLVGDLSGACSRRINMKHRLVYQVLDDIKTVKVIRMWTHYEWKHDGDAYVFKPFSSISSNRFSFSIRSPRFDKRLAAGWLILSLLPISMVLIPSFRCAQKHKSARASTV